MLGLAGVAAKPQEPVLESAALQVAIECLPHMAGQLFTGLSQVFDEGRVVALDELVEQCALGPVALGPFRPCRSPAWGPGSFDAAQAFDPRSLPASALRLLNRVGIPILSSGARRPSPGSWAHGPLVILETLYDGTYTFDMCC